MANGQTFTVLTRFGVSNGPTYSGQTSVEPWINGNTVDLIDATINPDTTETVVPGTIDITKLAGFGFTCVLVSGTLISGATVKFVDGGPFVNGGSTDYEFTLAPGQSQAWTSGGRYGHPPDFANNASSITVTGDITGGAVLEVQGIVVYNI